MPMIQLPIPDVNRTVLRPLVMGVVRDIMVRTGIGPDTQIKYAGPLGQLIQPGSSPVGKDEGNRAQFGSQPAIKVEVSERLVDEEASVNNVFKTNHAPVFIDNELGVYMRPDTAFHEVQLSLTIRHPDELTAQRWKDALRYNLRAGKLVYSHSVKWYTHMDPVIMILMKEIHRLREAVDGYGDTYEEYLADHFGPKIQLITTMEPAQEGDERRNALVHAESVGDIRGWFDFPLTSDNATKSDNDKNFETQVTYTIQFDKPSNWNFLYPISVHNQLLSDTWRRKDLAGDEQNVVKIRSQMNETIEYFRMARAVQEHAKETECIQIPRFDDFIPSMEITRTRGLWNALVQLEQEEPDGLLLDLNDMGEFEFSDTVKAFLKGEAPFVAKTFKSVFQIYLYERDRLLNAADYLYMTDDLKIYCKRELDFRKVYHLRFSVVEDLSLLDQDAIDRIIKFDPDMEDWPNVILDTVYPGIGNCWGPGEPITERELKQLIWLLANNKRGTNGNRITCAEIRDPNAQFEDHEIKPRTFSLYMLNVHRIDPS